MLQLGRGGQHIISVVRRVRLEMLQYHRKEIVPAQSRQYLCLVWADCGGITVVANKDERIAATETIIVPFEIGLNRLQPFTFSVDVFGVLVDSTEPAIPPAEQPVIRISDHVGESLPFDSKLFLPFLARH